MQQLVLNLDTSKAPSLNTFVAGKNEELIQLLRQFALRASEERFAYLWGERAVGKTHLLQALALFPATRYIPVSANQDAFTYDPQITLYLLDGCDNLIPERQISAFNLFNEIRANKGFLVSSGSTAPAQLSVRDDLKSRMSWGLIYRIHSLTDEEKMNALSQHAQERGLKLGTGILNYLMTHYQRDMRSLSLILDALDHYSLETKRAITLPLLLELLQKD